MPSEFIASRECRCPGPFLHRPQPAMLSVLSSCHCPLPCPTRFPPRAPESLGNGAAGTRRARPQRCICKVLCEKSDCWCSGSCAGSGFCLPQPSQAASLSLGLLSFFLSAAPLATTPAVWKQTPNTMTPTGAGGPCAEWTPTASTW